MRAMRTLLAIAVLASAVAAHAAPAPAVQSPLVVVDCSSKPGEREHCTADTSKGITLGKSTGESPCLLGKTWGYDDTGVWVSDGCSGRFVTGVPTGAATPEAAEVTKQPAPVYTPNFGFRLVDTEYGQIYMRLYTYVRYLNQKGLDNTYTDSFGTVKNVQQRQDIQLNKFFLPFSGWFLTPKLRYFLYIWSSNPAQGEPAQVVGAGNIGYTFNRFFTLGGGVSAVPSTRSTEGQFPYWLGVDDRMIADEFFRGSYTTGIWVKGEIAAKARYMVMLGNNLSQLGISAAQLDNHLDTISSMIQWLPTTGEFGYFGGFGDYDYHEQVATRVGLHYTHSREDAQSQPGTESIENSQIRLTDGNSIFARNLFGPGISVDNVYYDMVALDFGVKYKGLAFEAEGYGRKLSHFAGPGTSGIDDIKDTGYQALVSGMAIRDTLQFYATGSQILGDHGDGSEVRLGMNWWPLKRLGLRWNTEWIHLSHCPVGYTAVPYPVGGNGDIFTTNVEMNF